MISCAKSMSLKIRCLQIFTVSLKICLVSVVLGDSCRLSHNRLISNFVSVLNLRHHLSVHFTDGSVGVRSLSLQEGKRGRVSTNGKISLLLGFVFLSTILGTCCSRAIDCSSLASRGSLFVVILRLLSDPDGFECPALFLPTLSPPSPRHHQCHRCCSVGSHPVRVLVPSLSSRHSCQYPVQSLWRCWVVCLIRMILHARLRGVVSMPALCPVQTSLGILIRDDRWHWPSSECLSLQ